MILSGTGFVAGDTTLLLDDLEVAAVVTNSTTLSFNAPSHVAGTVAVRVRTAGGQSNDVAGGLTYTAAPVVDTLVPNAGPLTGSTGVVLSGANFVPGGTTLTLDGNAITPTAVTATSITFDAPAHPAGNVAVTVTTSGGTASVSGGYTYTDLPTVGTLSPASGPLVGTSGVVLSGGNFVPGATTVIFDGQNIVPSTVTTSSLTFDAPSHAAGTVQVAVSTPGGTSGNVSGGYTYLTAPTVTTLAPTNGPVSGSSGVTLNGSGFIDGATTVNFDGRSITPTSVSALSLTFDAPPAHGSGNVTVSVTTAGGTSGNVSGGFTYYSAPMATSLTPNGGPIAGGTSVNVQGTGFISGQTSVAVGGTPVASANFTVNSPTSLTFITPARAAGSATVTVTNPAGTSIGQTFTYFAAPTLTAVNPLMGAAGSPITLTGTGFSGATGVFFGSTPATSMTVVSNDEITAVVPAGSGLTSVTVVNPGGTSGGQSFSYALVLSGDNTFSTTTGLLNGSAVPGWNGTQLNLSGSLLIDSGATLTVTGENAFEVMALGDIVINGTIAANGSDGGQGGFSIGGGPAGAGGPGGFAGGAGDHYGGGTNADGSGPGAGVRANTGNNPHGGGGAGHSVPGAAGQGNTAPRGDGGAAYASLPPFVGGSGGGGAGSGSSVQTAGGGGGGGGGAVHLNTAGTLSGTGTINCNGGRGGNGAGTSGQFLGGGGGGGSGGTIWLIASITPTLTNLNVLGGEGGTAAGGAVANGGAGAPGRILVQPLLRKPRTIRQRSTRARTM